MASVHPTKDALIRTVVTLLDSKTIEEITSDQVLEISGISRGSMYHHFEDFSELIEAAQVARFATFVDRSCVALTKIVTEAKSREEMLTLVTDVTINTQSALLKAVRMERINAMAKSFNHPRMQKALGLEQERLTSEIADIYREACEKGWGDKNLDPRAVAVLIQSYTVGKAVDDFTPNTMAQESWNALIGNVLEKVIFPAS